MPAGAGHIPPHDALNLVRHGHQWRTIESLPPYPGMVIAKPSIEAQERMGPTILSELLLGGRDLETHVRAVMGAWKLESKNFSPSAHAEAVNLALVLHLMILEARCPRAALRNSLATEVMLRRLFCLLEVERQVAQGSVSRPRAWQSVDMLLEHRPDGYTSGATMSKFIADTFNQISKFEGNLARNGGAAKK